MRDHSSACVYTRGLCTPAASQHNIFDEENLSQIFLVLLTQAGYEPIGSLDLESDALPTEPPRHQVGGVLRQPNRNSWPGSSDQSDSEFNGQSLVFSFSVVRRLSSLCVKLIADKKNPKKTKTSNVGLLLFFVHQLNHHYCLLQGDRRQTGRAFRDRLEILSGSIVCMFEPNCAICVRFCSL